MHNWFECKVSYVKNDENTGKEKKVTEPYLVDALSFTEAEGRFLAELEKIMHGEYNLVNISKCKFTDIFTFDEGDRYYKCKVSFIDVDEKSGKEKKTNNMMLVLADNVKHAYDRIEESLASVVIPYEIHSIIESPIIDIFPYFGEEETLEIPENFRPLTEEEKNALDSQTQANSTETEVES